MHRIDTIFALSSGPPPAAICVIRISGPDAHDAGRTLATSLPDPSSAGVREIRHPISRALLDEALVLRFDGPRSSTGEDLVELHCHGGRAVVEAVLGALGSFENLRIAEPGEFTRRAFENGRIDLTEAEGLADLIEAETESQRKAALALAEGGLRKQIANWQNQLLGLSAAAERAIDYDDEDAPLSPLLAKGCGDLAKELDCWLAQPRVEPLKDGLRVVIAGPPNSGKSSLVNILAGYDRAIVTDIPGTTRDHIDVPVALEGIPVILTDTAGLRETTDAIEAIGVARASALMEEADVLVWLGTAADAPRRARLIGVQSKADLSGQERTPEGFMAISSVTGLGIAALLERIIDLARDLLPTEGAIALNRRQASHIEEAAAALSEAASSRDLVLVAENLRAARHAFDRLTGAAGLENVLDSLFGRFCLGK